MYGYDGLLQSIDAQKPHRRTRAVGHRRRRRVIHNNIILYHYNIVNLTYQAR